MSEDIAYKTAEDMVGKGIRYAWITFDDGLREKRRLFKSNTGSICIFSGKSRKYGYMLPLSVVKVEPIIPQKPITKKWEDGWKKVIKMLQKSGLWEQIIKEIELALEIGYEGMQDAYKLYWDPKDDKHAELLQKYPLLKRFNDNNEPYVDTSVLWSYHSLPKVKKMYFGKGRGFILEMIAKHMKDKTPCSFDERASYDVSFQYKPETNKAWYSEEYRGCGNGHYYLAIDSSHALFYEDD